MDLESLVDQQRQKTAETWSVLLDHGLREGSPLDVETFFFADDEAAAVSLVEALAAEGTTATTESFQAKAGLFRKKTVWAVQADSALPVASLAVLADLTEAMVRQAARAGAVYDGWGAQIPES
ncbi:ribonuclease E inhibitor RraB [Cellulomonas sp. WB94]|uniref:ribonuclease E inhibitor RraB n=1 Tax=Cellulomonas sp. WB94 TaxID=2173174 RepID=UPI001304C930|nr:ribonuclease E inhibitor RraB [Cellulomonas sp. WB94]